MPQLNANHKSASVAPLPCDATIIADMSFELWSITGLPFFNLPVNFVGYMVLLVYAALFFGGFGDGDPFGHSVLRASGQKNKTLARATMKGAFVSSVFYFDCGGSDRLITVRSE